MNPPYNNRKFRAIRVLAAAAMLLLAATLPLKTRAQGVSSGSTTNAPYDDALIARRAKQKFEAARARLQSNPDDPEAQWQLGRAAYDAGDIVSSRSQRADIAEQGIAACRKLIAHDPKSVPGHYYLSLNLGELARTKEIGALRLVNQMEAEYKIALGLDPAFDNAGSDRGLGLLYLDAPGWPLSIGSRSKARQHLQQAVKLAPDYPENLMNLIEAELEWDDVSNALLNVRKLDTLWPAARKQLVGEEHDADWSDWEKRRKIVNDKIEELSNQSQSPRKP